MTSNPSTAIEDYDLALKQDLVYNQVEQASENYRIIKINTITVYLTPMILKLMWNNWVQISTKLARANVIQKYYELLSVSGQLNQTFNLSKI
jgi:DNA repair photolyase